MMLITPWMFISTVKNPCLPVAASVYVMSKLKPPLILLEFTLVGSNPVRFGNRDLKKASMAVKFGSCWKF